MTEKPSLRERKKQRTRLEIEAAALDLFDDRGFEATTIDDIAAAADIAPRTFFHYFRSKEDVVVADYTIRLDRLMAALKASPADPAPWPALRDAFLAVGADYEAEREKLLRRFRIIQETPSVAARNLLVQARWEDAVAIAVAEWLGLDRTGDIRPRLIAGAALAAMRASIGRWLTDDGHSRLPDHIAECFALLGEGLDGIGPPA